MSIVVVFFSCCFFPPVFSLRSLTLSLSSPARKEALDKFHEQIRKATRTREGTKGFKANEVIKFIFLESKGFFVEGNGKAGEIIVEAS